MGAVCSNPQRIHCRISHAPGVPKRLSVRFVTETLSGLAHTRHPPYGCCADVFGTWTAGILSRNSPRLSVIFSGILTSLSAYAENIGAGIWSTKQLRLALGAT